MNACSRTKDRRRVLGVSFAFIVRLRPQPCLRRSIRLLSATCASLHSLPLELGRLKLRRLLVSRFFNTSRVQCTDD